MNRFAKKINLTCLATIVLLMAITVQMNARQTNPISITVTAVDHYTETLLDSVHLRLFREGVLLDSTITGADGQAVLYITATSIPQTGDKPTSFSLGHNYPNPFLDETRVDVALPYPQQLQIEVFNILGQRVARSTVPLQEGYYTLNMALGNLPTGVYLLRMTGTESRVVKMTKVGRGGFIAGDRLHMQPGISPSMRKTEAGISESGYMLRADRNRYRTEEQPAGFTESIALTLPMIRNNRVVVTAAGTDELPLNEEIEVQGDQFFRSVVTPDTLVLKSGIYSVRSRNRPVFNVEQLVEVVSRDTVFRFAHEVPMEVVLGGRVINESGERISGSIVRVFKNGSFYTEVIANSEGLYEVELLADMSLYSIIASAPATAGHEFDPLNHTGYSTNMRTLVPRPMVDYSMNFVLRTEKNLISTADTGDSLIAPVTLATPDGSVSVWGLLPEMQIVGGSARAYSPTFESDAFPGEFETRQSGLESGLVSAGFVSVNLLRDNDGTLEPVSKLLDENGDPVRVTFRFRMDPADWPEIRPDEFYNHLPGYVNRPDRINVPLYHYDEEAGDWILTGEFGWLESMDGPIPPSRIEEIRSGSFQGNIYVVGTTDHFSFINLDYPWSNTCITGQLVSGDGNPIQNAWITIRSMPNVSGAGYTYFSSTVLRLKTNQDGLFRVTVPRSERDASDDWNNNGRIDEYRIQIIYEVAGDSITIFNNNGAGYATPVNRSDTGCGNIGTLVDNPRKALIKHIELTFLENPLSGTPDYPLFVTPPLSVYNVADAVLTDPLVPQSSLTWDSLCGSGNVNGLCQVIKTVTSPDGKVTLAVPVFPDGINDPPGFLNGLFRYQKSRPDLGAGIYEVSDCSFTITKTVNSETVLCDVERRGPPVITILQPQPTNMDTQNPEYNFLFDDEIILEATGTDYGGNPIDLLNQFAWFNVLDWRLAGLGRIFNTTAGAAFGSGSNRVLRVAGRDIYGQAGFATLNNVNVSEVSISIPFSQYVMGTGTSFLSNPVVTGASNTGVFWSSSDETVATATPNGRVFGHAPGFATLTARSIADPTKFVSIEVEVEHLVLTFTVTPPAGNPDTEFTFDASVSEGDIVTYEWELGDGNLAFGSTVVHTYGEADEYWVTLEVTTAKGSWARMMKLVSTTGNPIAVIQASKLNGNPPMPVNFDGSESFSPLGSIISWEWDFGDGNSASGATVSHTYTTSGIFIARLTVTDDQGKTAYDDVQLVVNAPPVASFTVNPATGIPPLLITTDASASYDPDGTITRYSWDFGDGHIVFDGNVSEQHIYTNSGFYTIRLTVTDDLGATAMATRSLTTTCSSVVAGNFLIQTMQDFEQVEGICRIAGSIIIEGAQITGLQPLYALEQVDGFIAIRNAAISTLNGLEALYLIGDRMEIAGNNSLVSTTALSGLKSVDRIFVYSNPELNDLAGLDQIEGIIQDIRIYDNEKMQFLNAFNNVVQITSLHISNNPALVTLNAFALLDRIDHTMVFRDNGLSQCEVLELRERLIKAGGIGSYGDGNVNVYMDLRGNADILTGDFSIANASDISQMQGICAIQGNLSIQNSNLTSLAGLDSLMAVTGYINISVNQQLSVLSGLGNLVEVGGALGISFNNSLESLAGLNRLRTANALSVSNNPLLLNMLGLESLEELGRNSWPSVGGLSIHSNPLLESLDGLNGLRFITGNVMIFSLDALTSIAGLENLESTGGTFSPSTMMLSNLPLLVNLDGLENLKKADSMEFSDLPLLQNLDGLRNLEVIRGRLTFRRLNSLAGFAGMSGIQTIQWVVSISEMPGMTALQGIEPILLASNGLGIGSMPDLIGLTGLESLQTYGQLSITSNPMLESLAGLEALQEIDNLQLADNGGLISIAALGNLIRADFVEIKNNPMLESLHGLESLQTVEHLSLSGLPEVTDLAGLSGLQVVSNFTLESMSSLVTLSGIGPFNTNNSLSLSGLPINDFSGLENLTSVTGRLSISGLPEVQNLTGLNNLMSIDGQFLIVDNPALTDLSGLSSLNAVNGTFIIRSNAALQHLGGLNSLQTVMDLRIEQNNSLTNMSGLSNLEGTVEGIWISQNPLLETLTGLDGITTVTGVSGIRIDANPMLQNLSGLSNLERITNGGLVIQSNTALGSVFDMTALARVGGWFHINQNTALPTCDAEALRDQVLAREGIGSTVTISGNDDAGQCPAGYSVVD